MAAGARPPRSAAAERAELARHVAGGGAADMGRAGRLAHDPGARGARQKWIPVFGKDHAPSVKLWSAASVRDQRARHPKASSGPVLRILDAAIRGAEKRRQVFPRAAAVDAAATIAGNMRRAVHGRVVIVAIETILHPFGYVAVHVVHTERVGCERSDLDGVVLVEARVARG